LDHLWAWYHRHYRPIVVLRKRLGDDYMVLYCSKPAYEFTSTAGPDYWIRLIDSSSLERAHVFTCFENNCTVALDNVSGTSWNIGIVVRVFRNKRVPKLGEKDAVSHTQRLYENPLPLQIDMWGPMQGEMTAMVADSLRKANVYQQVVLVCAGSGVNFAIDAVQKFGSHVDFKVIFTTRDKALHKWVFDAMHNILVPGSRNYATVVCALTGLAGVSGQGAKMTLRSSDTVSFRQRIKQSLDEIRESLSFQDRKKDLVVSMESGVEEFEEDSMTEDSMTPREHPYLVRNDVETASAGPGPLVEGREEKFRLGKRERVRRKSILVQMEEITESGVVRKRNLANVQERLDFEAEIPGPDTDVFFQGGDDLKKRIQAICIAKQNNFFGGAGGYS